MGSLRQRTAVLLTFFSLLVAGLTASPAQAAPRAAAPAWQLVDYQQKSCYVSTRGGTSYYGIWIAGTWTHQIDVGAAALPAGASYYTSYAPIPAGTSDGVGSLAYVDVVLPVGAAVGTFTASMWASDGTTTETVPITIVVNATSCRHY